jgi:hypothetical protein
LVIMSGFGNGVARGAECAAGRAWLVVAANVAWLWVSAPAADIAPRKSAVARAAIVILALSVMV